MTVAVVSCVYGDYGRFIPRWSDAIRALDPAPDQVIVAADRDYNIPGAHVTVSPCSWRHPQAFYLNRALGLLETEWAWISDIDDVPYPDALAGLDQVQADVWQMGFDRSDGERYIPPQLTNDQYLASPSSVYVGASAVRLEAFRRVGGFRDVAFQDWALWARLASKGATFESSGRTHFRYNRHSAARGETELTTATRSQHLTEMEASLATV